MNALFTTLGGSWNDQCLIALVLLHTLLGYDTALAPTAELTPEVFAQTLNASSRETTRPRTTQIGVPRLCSLPAFSRPRSTPGRVTS